MTRPKVLVFDAGRNIGDNLRAFGVLRAFTLAHPELEVVCWLTPEMGLKIGPLLHEAQAVTRLYVHPRSPRETYVINHELMKYIKIVNKEWLWSSFPGGKGPDQQKYDTIIPTGEAWFSAKLLQNQGIEQPETINPGAFVAALLGLSEHTVLSAQPLLGRRAKPERYVTVGLGRPDPHDPKQLPPGRRKLVWQTLLDSGVDLVAVDYQDHSPPPRARQVTDFRKYSLKEKVDTMNRAAFHVGSDSGLVHFAAACGCPTIGFYRGPVDESGLVFGPWPRKGTGGKHVYAHSFGGFIERIQERAALVQGGASCPASV